MIRVAFVIDTIESATAGTERQLLILLRNIDRGVFRPVLCVLRMSDFLRYEFQLCPVYDVGLYSYKNPQWVWNLVRFSRYLKREGVDIVQTYFREANKVGVLAARIAGIKGVASARRNQGYWFDSKEKYVQRLFNHWVSLFIANAVATKRWASEVEGIPPEKIKVIYNALDFSQFEHMHEGTRRKYRAMLGIPDGSSAIVMVANLRSIKRYDVFIRAAEIVKKCHPKTRFFAVGTGTDSEKLRYAQLAKDLGLEDEVRFLGSRTDVPQILGAMDIGVLSSDSESFSNSVIEYMAAGLPVVCTDAGGAREAVKDGVNGFVVRCGDFVRLAEGILEVIREGPSRYSETNRQAARQSHGLKEIVTEYETAYLSLAQAKNGNA